MDREERDLVRLLAGAPALDRRTLARPGSHPRWFEPHHVRDRAGVRAEMAAQVSAGADVLLAPTWLTHRRALLPVGETRRAAEWTAAAIAVAREAADAGLERRAQKPATTDGWIMSRPSNVLVIGVVPDLDVVADLGSGRLAAREPGVERDEHGAVALLADAGVYAILLEPRATPERTQASASIAAETGVPAWVMVDVGAATPSTGDPVGRVHPWVESAVRGGAAAVMLSAGNPRLAVHGLADVRSAAGGVAAGVVFPRPPGPATDPPPPGVEQAPDAVPASVRPLVELIEAGSTVLGIIDGADAAALGPLRAARDTAAAARAEARSAADERWSSFVMAAASAAPAGRAVWVGPARGRRPDGFDWSTVGVDEVPRLPAEQFRLVVVGVELDPAIVAPILERGGVLAAVVPEGVPFERLAADGLRVLGPPEAADRDWLIARRED